MLLVVNALVLFIGIYLLIKEIAVPLIKGRQVFPSFRKSQSRQNLDTARKELLDLKEETEIQKELEEVKLEKALLTKNESIKNESA